MQKIHNFTVLPALPKALADLEFIARNMFWSWSPEFIELFKRVDGQLWHATSHDPVKLLGCVSQQSLEALAQNKGFLSELRRAADKLREYLAAHTWFEKVAPDEEADVIAYFSAEFGLSECLPIYSGGLGVLAGDHLKSASDLGVPLVGVGLLYQKGYFSQYLNIDGWQQEVYVENDFYNMPIELASDVQGQPLTIGVQYPGRVVYARIWCVTVGRVKLYLLDTNIDNNSLEDRVITANLYGGDREMRIKQEIMLGIGGLRALKAMGIEPAVCHMNEGHAAFMALERIRLAQQESGLNFEEALEATKSGNVFTVHTPVKAGNDEFGPEMMDKYFADYFPQLGLNEKQFLALGRFNMENGSEQFKMPVLAMRLSSYRNGVSKLHGEVSRNMWTGIWPGVPTAEVPITSITNGIHIRTWLSEEMNTLYERYLGPNWADEATDQSLWQNVHNIPDEEIWRTHLIGKGNLVAFARNRLKAQMQRRGTYHTELNWADEVLDQETLTIGFARRFASYKRGNLLLKDPQRLMRLLMDVNRPVQIVFAGKAHPRDNEGKEIIRQIIHFANQYDVRRRIVFLENYNMDVGAALVRGVDVWLNNPRPPMEASGTSGMKAAINGALNLSTLDGWWCEGYRPEGGWVIGVGESYDDPGYQDTVESQALYNILENEIIPLFYSRGKDNIPRAWIHRMKNSMNWITPRFNTHRMVTDYAEKFYIPAAAKYRALNDRAQQKAKELSNWKAYMKTAWPELEVKDVQIKVEGNGDGLVDPKKAPLRVGSQLHIKALVNLGRAAPRDVTVELYHGPVDSWGNITQGVAIRMQYEEAAGNNGDHWFMGRMPCDCSGRQGMAVRILPHHDDLTNPCELGLILWQDQSHSASQCNR